MNEQEEIINLFRASGGILENATIDYSEDKGFLCKSIDPDKPVKMFCPRHLLIKVEHIGINEDGLFISDWSGYEEHRDFLERYFRFHFNRKLVENFLEEEKEISSIPQKEMAALNSIGLPVFYFGGRLSTSTGLEYARQRILAAHKISHHTGVVIMPIISCVNHSKDGVPFDIEEEGISVSGQFNGEIFALYSRYDPVILYNIHRFVSETAFTYSLPININLPYGSKLAINNDYADTPPSDNGIRIPNVSVNASGVLYIPWFPLHCDENSDYPVMIARIIEKKFTGYPVKSDNLLNTTYKFTINALTSALKTLRPSNIEYVQGAVRAIELQLEQIGK